MDCGKRPAEMDRSHRWAGLKWWRTLERCLPMKDWIRMFRLYRMTLRQLPAEQSAPAFPGSW